MNITRATKYYGKYRGKLPENKQLTNYVDIGTYFWNKPDVATIHLLDLLQTLGARRTSLSNKMSKADSKFM